MKRFLIFAFLLTEVKAIDLTLIGLSLQKKKKEPALLHMVKKPLHLEAVKKKESTPIEKKKVRLNVETNCSENYGESRYTAQAGVHYAVNSDFGIETGYELLDVKVEKLNDLKIDKDHLALYGRVFLKF